MSKSKDLDAAVQDVIKAGQIGQPVFVRCMVGAPDDREDQLNLLVDIIMNVRAWMGDSATRIYAVGTWALGLSILVQFRNGGTALISEKKARDTSADLIILGNHGALYHDATALDAAKLTRAFPENETKRSVRAALEIAVERGTPQAVVDGSP